MSGPYVVTTKRANSHVPYAWDRQPLDSLVVVSRRAVATLEEARLFASETVCLAERHGSYTLGELYATARTLPKSGGTVGPLPDGTVVEVAPVSLDALHRGALPLKSKPEGFTPGELCDAFNAREQS